MEILGIIVIAVVCLIIFSLLVDMLSKKSRKEKSKHFQINDLVKISHMSTLKEPQKLHRLVGWSEDYLFVDEYGVTHRCNWNHLEYNKSWDWRRYRIECEKYMGKTPGFSGLIEEVKPSSQKIDEIPIDTMNETQCQVYLKQAIEEENFEVAELIRKRLENFK